MDLSCPYCSASYSVDEADLDEDVIYVRCEICDQRFILRKSDETGEHRVEREVFRCPNCGAPQKRGDACVECETIFDKFEKHRQVSEHFINDSAPARTQNILVKENTIRFAFPVLTKIDTFITEFNDRFLKNKNTYRRMILKWLRTLLDESIRVLILYLVGVIIFCGILYSSKIFWHLYIETHVGQRFISQFPGYASQISYLLSQDLFYFSLEYSLICLITCTVIGGVCQLTNLNTWFYFSRGFIGRYIVWGAVCAAANAYVVISYIYELELQTSYYVSDFQTAMALALLPCVMFSGSSFLFTTKILPELSDIYKSGPVRILFSRIFSPARQLGKAYFDKLVSAVKKEKF